MQIVLGTNFEGPCNSYCQSSLHAYNKQISAVYLSILVTIYKSQYSDSQLAESFDACRISYIRYYTHEMNILCLKLVWLIKYITWQVLSYAWDKASMKTFFSTYTNKF